MAKLMCCNHNKYGTERQDPFDGYLVRCRKCSQTWTYESAEAADEDLSGPLFNAFFSAWAKVCRDYAERADKEFRDKVQADYEKPINV